MNKFQAQCEDGWKSKTVEAKNMDEAADMVENDMEMHLKETHSMDLPSNPEERHKEVVAHMKMM